MNELKRKRGHPLIGASKKTAAEIKRAQRARRRAEHEGLTALQQAQIDEAAKRREADVRLSKLLSEYDQLLATDPESDYLFDLAEEINDLQSVVDGEEEEYRLQLRREQKRDQKPPDVKRPSKETMITQIVLINGSKFRESRTRDTKMRSKDAYRAYLRSELETLSSDAIWEYYRLLVGSPDSKGNYMMDADEGKGELVYVPKPDALTDHSDGRVKPCPNMDAQQGR
jgi:hypothetical protein